MTRGCRRDASGFSLLEALFALSVVALALLLGLGLLAQQRRILERLDARREADRMIEETLEGLRSGAVPLPRPESAARVPLAPRELAPAAGAAGLEVLVRVAATERPADLYHVWVVARYRAAGRPVVRTVETEIWRPGLMKGAERSESSEPNGRPAQRSAASPIPGGEP